MVTYSYIPIAQVGNLTFLNDSNVIATPATWSFESYGNQYGGIECEDITTAQANEITSLGGQTFDKDGFLTGLNAMLQNSIAVANASTWHNELNTAVIPIKAWAMGAVMERGKQCRHNNIV